MLIPAEHDVKHAVGTGRKGHFFSDHGRVVCPAGIADDILLTVKQTELCACQRAVLHIFRGIFEQVQINDSRSAFALRIDDQEFLVIIGVFGVQCRLIINTDSADVPDHVAVIGDRHLCLIRDLIDTFISVIVIGHPFARRICCDSDRSVVDGERPGELIREGHIIAVVQSEFIRIDDDRIMCLCRLRLLIQDKALVDNRISVLKLHFRLGAVPVDSILKCDFSAGLHGFFGCDFRMLHHQVVSDHIAWIQKPRRLPVQPARADHCALTGRVK